MGLLALGLGLLVLVVCGFWILFKRLTDLQKAALQNQAQEDRQFVERLKSELIASVHGMAQQSLSGNTQQFLELAKTSFEKDQAIAKNTLQNLLKPVQDMLTHYQEHIQQIEKDRTQSFARMESEMRRVAQTASELSISTQNLKTALKRPNVRGRWGEIQLKNCIELAGMSEFSDVNFQDSQRVDEKTLVPDMTVRMPGGRIVVVDAKTPIDAFLEALEATNDETKTVQMARHGRQVKDHVRKLSSRAYNEFLSGTADFTIMFLPNESFLYAALESEPDLVEYALQKKVLIATPPTLIGLLKVIRFGWNEAKLAENAARISEAGMELHKRLCDFVQSFADMGKHLERAKNEYDAAMSRLESRVIVQARRLEKLGAKSAKELPEGWGERDYALQMEIENR